MGLDNAQGRAGLGERWIWLGFAIGLGVIIAVAAWSLRSARRPGPLPVYGQVPTFSLIDSSGDAFGPEDLSGHPWVANLIFTRCQAICPLLSTRMERLYRDLEAEAEDVRFVSISVDPQHDRPEVLREYASRYRDGVDGRWRFLTGERSEIRRLLSDGFHLGVAEPSPEAPGDGLITHSDRFVLIDGRMRIRGYYPGSDEEALETLRRDAKRLAQESRDRGTQGSRVRGTDANESLLRSAWLDPLTLGTPEPSIP